MGRRCLLVFTKPPVPGRVKTRLIGHLSAAAAAGLHQALLDDLVEALGGGRFTIRLLLALESGETPPPAAAPVAAVLPQCGDDLGERLWNALADAGRDHSLVAVVGSDLPGLDAATVEEAFDRLDDGDDVVLGPTADGGYYLLAIRAERLHPRLFAGVAWSTDRVLAQTMARCDELGLRRSALLRGRDVDLPQDLEWLEACLREGRFASPRVADWLRRRQASTVAAPSGA